MGEAMIEPGEPLVQEHPQLRGPDGAVTDAFLDRVTAAIEARDAEGLRELAGDLHEADLGDLIAHLRPEYRLGLIELLGKDFDFAALTEVDDQVREEILDELRPETLAEGFRELDSDDVVYILQDLAKEDQAEILRYLPIPERAALQKSLDYPEDSVGRRMQTDFVAIPEFWTVGETIDYLRENQHLPDAFYEIFVVDPGFRLTGTVALDRLLRSKRPVKISEILVKDRQTVRATDDKEDAARLFRRYNLVSAPVLDENGRVAGVLTVDDVVDVIEEEAEEDIKALGGVTGHEQLSDPVFSIARGRFNWLLVNLATAFLASSVLGLFEGQLEKMVALAVLAPIVASQGGNAATQTMTVVVRALATRELGPANAWSVISREMLVSALNGIAFAVLTGIGAALWFKIPSLGVVIGLAMICNLLAGALGGVVIPLALNRFHADPAVSSGVFVTTITDVIGFFSFLAIATVWFGLR